MSERSSMSVPDHRASFFADLQMVLSQNHAVRGSVFRAETSLFRYCISPAINHHSFKLF